MPETPMDMPPDPISPIEEVNITRAVGLEAMAEEARSAFISDAFTAVKRFLLIQQEAAAALAEAGYPEMSPIELYALDGYEGLPLEEGSDGARGSVRTVSLRLSPEGEMKGTSHERLFVYVPIPEEVLIDEDLDVEALPEPDRVGIEYVRAGVVSSYVLDHLGLRPFSVDSDGEQTTEEEIAGEFGDDQVRRVNTNLPLITHFHETFINWKAQVQRVINAGDQN